MKQAHALGAQSLREGQVVISVDGTRMATNIQQLTIQDAACLEDYSRVMR